MFYDAWLNKQVKNRITDKDIACSTCKFNFGVICAGHDSLWGYGGEIEDFNKGCDQWEISLDYFIELAEKVEKEHGIKPGSL